MKKPKKTAKPKVTNQTKNDFQSNVFNTTKNGLGDAIGFPENQGTGWSTQLSQVNTLFKNNRWYLISNMRQLLSEIYVEIGLVQTIVDLPVDDGLRGGVTIKSKQLDEDEIEKILALMDREDDINMVGQGLKWNRLFGGAGVIAITDQDPSTPLRMDMITEDSPVEFRAVDMWELFWSKQNTDDYSLAIDSDDAGEVEFYDYYGVKLHASRVMIMKGLTAPSFIRPRLRGWGYSIMEALVRSINQYLKATDLGFEVLDEFKVDVFKIKNLSNSLLTTEGENAIKRRITMANWQKNYQHALVMDSEDDYDHKQLSWAGLADAMAGIRMQVASDMRIPLTKLFGISAAGFNSGEDDIENYNSMVESQVRNKCKYEIIKIIEMRCQQLFGFVPDDLQIEFKSLRILGAEQEENVKTQKFNRLMTAKEKGEITTFEFREGCNKENLLSITLDVGNDTLNPEDPDVADLLSGADEEVAMDAPDQDGAVPAAKAGASTSKAKDAPESKAAKPAKNSSEYDAAAFKVDGGDGMYDSRRKELFDDEYRFLDGALYQAAKEASIKSLSRHSWQFVMWWYKEHGGKMR